MSKYWLAGEQGLNPKILSWPRKRASYNSYNYILQNLLQSTPLKFAKVVLGKKHGQWVKVGQLLPQLRLFSSDSQALRMVY